MATAILFCHGNCRLLWLISRAAVNHKILLGKLEHYDIKGDSHLYIWFKSCLSNRKQALKIRQCISNFKTITCGVPQGGSVLCHALHGFSNQLNLEMAAELLMKNVSYLNLNISGTKNGRTSKSTKKHE